MNIYNSHRSQVARDEANLSKGYGFVSFSNFEASDDAIANLNGQYLMNKEVSVQYAYKKDGKGERHGDQAERMLSAEAKKHLAQPVGQPISAHLFAGASMGALSAMLDGDNSRLQGVGQVPNGLFLHARNAPPGNVVSHPPPRPNPQSQPLPAPPLGLPARPPPSQAGYGGPQSFLPPGFAPNPNSGYPMQPPTAPLAAPPGYPQGFTAVPPAMRR